MFSSRHLLRLGAAVAAFSLALPAMAGTLAPPLQRLADSYQHSPKHTLTHALQASDKRPLRLFSPHVNATGKVQVYMHYKNGVIPTSAALAQLGASDVLVSRPLGLVQAWIPIANLERAAKLGGIKLVDLPDYAYVKNSRMRPNAGGCTSAPTGLNINGDGIASERVQSLHTQGITGQGVKIGIISDGADCRSTSQAAGYLPSSIFIPPGMGGSGDEGTAMLELVHAMAPDATLGFCGPSTSADFVQCFTEFAQWGAQVISDDLGWFPVGYNFSVFTNPNTGNDALVEFANANPNISLTTSGGNDQQDYFEANYIADTSPSSPDLGNITLSPTYTLAAGLMPSQYSAAGRAYVSAMNFGAAAGQGEVAAMKVNLANGNSIYANLTWNDPAAGPYDDLDLFLVKSDGSVACAPSGSDEWCSSTMNQKTYGSQGLWPWEFLIYNNNTGSNQTLYLIAYCYDCSAHGSQPLYMKLYGFMNGGGAFQYTTSGGIAGHAALDVETTVAAARRGKSGRFSFTNGMENFSDIGPFAYNDWTQAVKTRQKPDITGIDGVVVSGAGGFSSPFYGTSAASPNVGAVLVLLRGAFPSAATTAKEWEKIITDTASPSAIGGFSQFAAYSLSASGAGLVDAAAAASSLAGGSVDATITSPIVEPFSVPPNTDVGFAATCAYQGNDTPSYDWTFGTPAAVDPPPVATGLTPMPVQYANGGIYTATFTCTVGGSSDSDQLIVEVQAAATVNDISVNVDHNKPFTAPLPVSGAGGEQLSGVLVTAPSHGQLDVDTTTGLFTYTPDTGYSGADSFSFKVDNGVKVSNTGTISLTVAQGQPPVAKGGTLTTSENQPASGTLVATDPDGDPLTFSIVSGPTNGTVTITDTATGAYTYTPTDGYTGADSFTFKANDGSFDSNTATVNITVTPNQPPVAQDGTLSTTAGKSASSTLVATDPEGDGLTFSIVAPPGHGSVSITNAATGAYTYTPVGGFTGSDSFIFKANDGTSDSNTATISITVSAAPPPPKDGGGGALGSLGLGLLGALLLVLRRKR